MTEVVIKALRHGRLPWRSALLAMLALALWWAWGAAPEALVWDRAALARGELWRLLTGHWVHSDGGHALWDIAALILLGFLFEPRLKGRLPGVLLAGSLGVDAWLWWAPDAPVLYCGLSGILNSLLAAGLVAWWREQPHVLIPLTGLGMLAKSLMELQAGSMLLTSTAWPGVPQAHLAGMAAGLVYTALLYRDARGCHETDPPPSLSAVPRPGRPG